ncbi:MAG: hypothetical protein ACOYB1_18560 [Limnohabitans sp.]
MNRRRHAPRSLKGATKLLLTRALWTALSILPGAVAIGLFGGMVMMFIVVLADVACLGGNTLVAIAQ